MGCGASADPGVAQAGGGNGGLLDIPMMAGMMQGMMRKKMNASMKVTEHDNDASYKEVQDFMVPSSVGKPFLNAPGTFDAKMEPRKVDKDGMMTMDRKMMTEGINAKGITWEKFQEHRGYALPDYEPKHPQPGDKAPDGKILSTEGGESSTLHAEAKRLADFHSVKKFVVAFQAITCPFARAYAFQDLYEVTQGVPILHIYIREAEPCDVFDAGGMHCTTPLALRRFVPWHKTEQDRACVAQETKKFLETFYGKGNCCPHKMQCSHNFPIKMWMDTMDDTLEKLYEARPWRYYVIDTTDFTVIDALGLAPFNMAGKIEKLKAACAEGGVPCPAPGAPGVPKKAGDLFAQPMMARMMQGMMRNMMNKSMKVTEHDNDATYKEVQAFMVPSSVGKPFTDAPGTFDIEMKPRKVSKDGMMTMDRKMMTEGVNAKGITWEKFQEHRGYAAPGYEPKHPQPGDKAPDGKILAIDGGTPSTLLAEAKKLAAAKGSQKVVLAFQAITCPFARAYAFQDLYEVTNGLPILHIYLREAEPCDVFDAGGMHCTTPLAMRRFVPWHKSEADRAMVAKETQNFLQGFYGKGAYSHLFADVPMWMDTMDDELEKLYEARPWRYYVIQADDCTIVDATGLAPFNMDGKIAKLKAACA